MTTDPWAVGTDREDLIKCFPANCDIFWLWRLKMVLAGDKLLREGTKTARHESKCHEYWAADNTIRPNARYPEGQ
jgi:hypothetical protein